jgi:hypothetical protein
MMDCSGGRVPWAEEEEVLDDGIGDEIFALLLLFFFLLLLLLLLLL